MLFGTGCLRMPGKRPLNDFIVSCAFLLGQQTFFKLVLLTSPAQTAVCLIPVESNCVINFSAFPVGVSPTPHTLHLPAPSPTPLPILYPGRSSHLSFQSLFVEAQEDTLIPLMRNRPTHTSVPTRFVGCSFGGWSPAPACSFEAGGLE